MSAPTTHPLPATPDDRPGGRPGGGDGLPRDPQATGEPLDRPVVLAALGLGAAAAVLLPGGPPGAGAVVLAVLAAVAVLALRRGTPRPTRWQVVHGTLALVLVVPAAVLDASWVVQLDLLTALLLAAVALAPHRTGTGVLLAVPRLLGRVPAGGARLVRGTTGREGVARRLGPAVRGAVIAALLLAVFVPLLASADPDFADLLLRATRVDDLHPAGALTAFVLVAALAATGLQLLRRPRPDVRLPPPVAVLSRTSEWLLPLGALDLLLAAFVAFRTRELTGAEGGYAALVHEGFFQLVAAAGLVLLVVAAAVRWTAAGAGVRAALGVLCVLTLLVDAAALQQLLAYTEAMGWTRLRAGVAAVCLGLAGVLVVLLVAGAAGLRRAGWRAVRCGAGGWRTSSSSSSPRRCWG